MHNSYSYSLKLALGDDQVILKMKESKTKLFFLPNFFKKIELQHFSNFVSIMKLILLPESTSYKYLRIAVTVTSDVNWMSLTGPMNLEPG